MSWTEHTPATILADTGPLYALIDRDDSWHARVAAWWKQQNRDVLVPVSVLPEVCYLLQSRISAKAEIAFVNSVANGEFAVEPLDNIDVARAAELMKVYADFPLGFVDATIIAMAERLEIRTILTTDRRHFGVVRSAGLKSLVLVP